MTLRHLFRRHQRKSLQVITGICISHWEYSVMIQDRKLHPRLSTSAVARTRHQHRHRPSLKSTSSIKATCPYPVCEGSRKTLEEQNDEPKPKPRVSPTTGSTLSPINYVTPNPDFTRSKYHRDISSELSLVYRAPSSPIILEQRSTTGGYHRATRQQGHETNNTEDPRKFSDGD